MHVDVLHRSAVQGIIKFIVQIKCCKVSTEWLSRQTPHSQSQVLSNIAQLDTDTEAKKRLNIELWTFAFKKNGKKKNLFILKNL